jgi:hypothetical protein
MVIGIVGRVYEMSRVELAVDDELIGRCLDGDQAAWRELVQKYQRFIRSRGRYALRIHLIVQAAPSTRRLRKFVAVPDRSSIATVVNLFCASMEHLILRATA